MVNHFDLTQYTMLCVRTKKGEIDVELLLENQGIRGKYVKGG